MTHALHRINAVLFGWIPDISAIPPRRQVTIGIIASLIFHLLLLGGIGIFAVMKPVPPKPVIKPKLRGITLTIAPPEPEPEPIMPFTLAARQETPFIDSRGLDLATDAALNPLFQSDQNMKAASELPASGDAPLPSQAGADRPFNAFKTQSSLLGAAARPFEDAMHTEPIPAVASVAPPPAPPLPPEPKPAPPAPPAEPAEKAENIAEKAAPPTPFKPVDKPRDDEISLAEKPASPPMHAVTQIQPATPRATPPPPRPVATPPPDQLAMLTTPVPRLPPPRDSGYQPEQEQNRIEGNISNRGKKAVDAVATPLAKYRKQINDAIGSRWYLYVRNPQKMSLIAPGSARITFAIDEQGQISRIKLESNNSNDSFAELCMSAVRDAREQIKEIKAPADVIAPLKDGKLECSLTFTFYNL